MRQIVHKREYSIGVGKNLDFCGKDDSQSIISSYHKRKIQRKKNSFDFHFDKINTVAIYFDQKINMIKLHLY